ncbi:hypothetical protein GWK47_048224 [Chionoecetes opilio]|uniref:Uncharacterized protein n=1 Tax=Chionoecetes opilio TaxID=41210 RepID=A0A8J4YB90_CHIOP|nr:hypothetical protein GWK47_048224 [Chionoecetes opilio]
MFVGGKRPARESVNAHLSPAPTSRASTARHSPGHVILMNNPPDPRISPPDSLHRSSRAPPPLVNPPQILVSPRARSPTQSPAAPPPPSPPLPGRRTLLWLADTLSRMRYLVDSGAEPTPPPLTTPPPIPSSQPSTPAPLTTPSPTPSPHPTPDPAPSPQHLILTSPSLPPPPLVASHPADLAVSDSTPCPLPGTLTAAAVDSPSEDSDAGESMDGLVPENDTMRSRRVINRPRFFRLQ